MKFARGSNLSGKKVLVVGLARSGVSAANLLISLGAKVYLTDLRSEEELKLNLGEIKGESVLCLGGHDRVPVPEMELAVISPGIPWSVPFLKKLRESGIRVVSELEFSAALIDTPIIAVTGTNGKTTTSTLISEMLRAGGRRVFTGGNIGTPLAEYVNSKERADYVVCEVSSFQLEGVRAFRPKISIILNITEDHLDRHADMNEYAGLKERIFVNQGEGDTLILNGDAPLLQKIVTPEGAGVRKFSCRKRVADGAWLEGGALFLEDGGSARRVCGVEEVPLSGEHNLENVMAALLAARTLGVKYSDIKIAIREFRPISHRMELVGNINGVTFVNDSKGTNVGAAEKSIRSFEGSVILIAGGKDKGGDYTPLIKAIRERAKYVVLMGEAGEKISRLLAGYENRCRVSTMEEAVARAVDKAGSGDTVLLSPACSSFDMFSSYMERGEAFKSAVSRMADLKYDSVARDA